MPQCQKIGKKLRVLVRICRLMTIERKRMLVKAFIESQFDYCLLYKCVVIEIVINYLQEIALRIFCSDNVSSVEDLLQKDQSASIHHRNICLFGTELYKTRNNIYSHIMNELFEQPNIIYNLRLRANFTTGPLRF